MKLIRILDRHSRGIRTSKDDFMISVFDKNNELIVIKKYGDFCYEELFNIECDNDFTYSKDNVIKVKYLISIKEYRKFIKMIEKEKKKWKIGSKTKLKK